jgi:hypothetical protein
MNHIHCVVDDGTTSRRFGGEPGVQKEVCSTHIVSEIKEVDLGRIRDNGLCISTITRAERDGSMSIALRSPLHGILYGVDTGLRSERVRSVAISTRNRSTYT